jgi:hypothetical protein
MVHLASREAALRVVVVFDFVGEPFLSVASLDVVSTSDTGRYRLLGARLVLGRSIIWVGFRAEEVKEDVAPFFVYFGKIGSVQTLESSSLQHRKDLPFLWSRSALVLSIVLDDVLFLLLKESAKRIGMVELAEVAQSYPIKPVHFVVAVVGVGRFGPSLVPVTVCDRETDKSLILVSIEVEYGVALLNPEERLPERPSIPV